MKPLIVLAIGGNSLILDEKKKSVKDQYEACQLTAKHLVKLIAKGFRLVITHGNGPQVGFILRRSELAAHELHQVPLDSCVADTQGAIGYNLQMAINNELAINNLVYDTVTIVTQVVVSKTDSSFLNPSKPIGSFLDKETALQRQKDSNWSIMEDAGRGYRRVVPSPKPIEIVELKTISTLLKEDQIVIAVGGGGIPVIKENNQYIGIEGVIDKDLASCLLAKNLKSDILVISTAVDKVYLNFGKPNQTSLSQITLSQAKEYVKEGHFKPGSMLPKIEAAIDFVEKTGNKAIITSPEHIFEACTNSVDIIGTHIVADK